MKSTLFVGSLMFAALCAAPAFGQTVVTVPGTSDLYAAGLAPGTNCCAGDTTPANSPVLAPLSLFSGETLTFSATGGAGNTAFAVNPTPDGNTASPFNLSASYGTGISGPTDVYLGGLAGVFLGATNPTGPAPAQLSGTAFSSIAPSLGQIFFIGDGLTGTGTGAVQQFFVPTGATRLYLGVIDDGGYYDNAGSIVATIFASSPPSQVASAAPEPATWAMMIVGFGLVGAAMRRRQKVCAQVLFAE